MALLFIRFDADNIFLHGQHLLDFASSIQIRWPTDGVKRGPHRFVLALQNERALLRVDRLEQHLLLSVHSRRLYTNILAPHQLRGDSIFACYVKYGAIA